MFEGFRERTLKEIEDIAPKSMTVKVTPWSLGSNAVWKGGSIVSCLSSFSDRWISHKDYDEYGP